MTYTNNKIRISGTDLTVNFEEYCSYHHFFYISYMAKIISDGSHFIITS